MRLLLTTIVAVCSVASAALGQAAAPLVGPDRPAWATAEAIEADLVRAMDDESARSAFLNSFLNGEVWVRVEQSTLDAAAQRQREGVQGTHSVELFASEVGGHTVIFAFTRPELAPAAFGREVPLLGMSGEAALRLQGQYGLSLNYNNGPGVTFTREDVAALLAAIQRRPVVPGTAPVP